jgi:hypothetical protein
MSQYAILPPIPHGIPYARRCYIRKSGRSEDRDQRDFLNARSTSATFASGLTRFLGSEAVSRASGVR